MNDLSPNTIRSNGVKYTLVIEIELDECDKNNSDQVFALDNTCLKKFKYSSEFNQLGLVGEIEYLDRFGKVDKLLDRHFTYCHVQFIEHDQKSDGQICVEKLDQNKKLIHTFLIQKVKILSRQGTEIMYKLELVSLNWFNQQQNIFFSNYDIGPQPIFDILKSCIKKAGMSVDEEQTFKEITTSVKLQYITSENDCLETIKRYLMNRLYYLQDKDDSIKALVYNETSDKIQLFDYKADKYVNGIYQTVVSMFKTQFEEIAQDIPNQFATITEIPTSEYIKNVFNYKMSDYDSDSNLFVDKSFSNLATIQYLNQKSSTNTLKGKYKIPFDGLNLQKSGTYWNNDLDIYTSTLQQQLKMNSIVLNTVGNLIMKPGALMTISFDRTMNTINSEKGEALNETKYKYESIEGVWIVGKVIHIIQPSSKQQYRQNLVLSRNFVQNSSSNSSVVPKS